MVFLLFVSAFLPQNGTIYAQTDPAPFSTIRLGINLSVKKNTSFIENYWEAKKGGEGFIEFPFYYGNISAGYLILPFKSKIKEKPDFSSSIMYLGWGKEIELPLNSSLYLGVKTGNYSFSFDDDTINVNLKSESEFAAGITSRFSMELFEGFGLNISGDLFKVFTKNRISLFVISGGLSYRFSSPIWIKELFE